MVDFRTVNVHNIILDWLKETGVEAVSLNVVHIENKNILEIYTEHPGYLIGKAGCFTDKYIPKIKEVDRFDDVKIKQINSIINVKDEKVNADEWLMDYFRARCF